MEGYTLRQQPLAALRGGSPLLRLASDERLIELTRRGQQAAFETLVSRYQSRLLAFCRHMLSSREDAEDVLQEVFAAAYNAMLADRREINVRPWLYRIARNRSLNHLRRATAIGVDSMDTHFADAGLSTSEKAHRREEFRSLLDDIAHLPETQRTALVLREMDALSYEQIAETMDTTVPSVKSLLVRARIGLAEAAEARKLTCEEVRLELGAVAEGVAALSPPVRRHVKGCERCRSFRSHLRANKRALAAVFPLGPLVLLKKTFLAKLGLAKLGGAGGGAGASAGGATAAVTGGTAAAGGGAVAAGAGAGVGGFAAGAVGLKAAVVVATMATVAVVAHNSKPAMRIPPPSAPSAVASVPAQQMPPTVYPQSAPGPAAATVIRAAAPRRTRVTTPTLLAPRAFARHRALAAGGPDGAVMLAISNIAVAASRASAPGAGATTPDGATVMPTGDTTATPTTQYLATTTTFSDGATATDLTGATGDTTTQQISTTTAFGSTSSTTTQEISTTTAFPSGTTGATDPIGTTASVGSTSATGTSGAMGVTGQAGTSGATGATSATGTSGATGTTGTTGTSGATGTTGTSGATGTTGTTGATGETGATGVTGSTAATGASGPTASTGGTTSASGPAGTTAVTGPSGVAGGTGPTGTTAGAAATSVTGRGGHTAPAGPAGS